VEIQERKHSLRDIVGSFKSAATRRCRQQGLIRGSTLWHRGFYDHIIRTEKSLMNIRQYILNNPINWYVDRLNPEYRPADSAIGPSTLFEESYE